MLRRFSFLALLVVLAMVFSTMAMAATSATETYNVTLTVDPSILAYSTLALTLAPNGIPNATSSVVNSAGYFKSNGPTTFTYAATALQRSETDTGASGTDYVKTWYVVKLNDGTSTQIGLNLVGDNDLGRGKSPSYGPGSGENITAKPHGGQIGIEVTVGAEPIWTDDSGVYAGALTITATVSSY